MTEHAETLDDGSKEAIEVAVAKVNEASSGEDADAINAAVSELEQATHALSKHMYESADESGAAGAAPEAAAAEGTAGDAADDDVIDAEFEKKEDD